MDTQRLFCWYNSVVPGVGPLVDVVEENVDGERDGAVWNGRCHTGSQNGS